MRYRYAKYGYYTHRGSGGYVDFIQRYKDWHSQYRAWMHSYSDFVQRYSDWYHQFEAWVHNYNDYITRLERLVPKDKYGRTLYQERRNR